MCNLIKSDPTEPSTGTFQQHIRHPIHFSTPQKGGKKFQRENFSPCISDTEYRRTKRTKSPSHQITNFQIPFQLHHIISHHNTSSQTHPNSPASPPIKPYLKVHLQTQAQSSIHSKHQQSNKLHIHPFHPSRPPMPQNLVSTRQSDSPKPNLVVAKQTQFTKHMATDTNTGTSVFYRPETQKSRPRSNENSFFPYKKNPR